MQVGYSWTFIAKIYYWRKWWGKTNSEIIYIYILTEDCQHQFIGKKAAYALSKGLVVIAWHWRTLKGRWEKFWCLFPAIDCFCRWKLWSFLIHLKSIFFWGKQEGVQIGNCFHNINYAYYVQMKCLVGIILLLHTNLYGPLELTNWPHPSKPWKNM